MFSCPLRSPGATADIPAQAGKAQPLAKPVRTFPPSLKSSTTFQSTRAHPPSHPSSQGGRGQGLRAQAWLSTVDTHVLQLVVIVMFPSSWLVTLQVMVSLTRNSIIHPQLDAMPWMYHGPRSCGTTLG